MVVPPAVCRAAEAVEAVARSAASVALFPAWVVSVVWRAAIAIPVAGVAPMKPVRAASGSIPVKPLGSARRDLKVNWKNPWVDSTKCWPTNKERFQLWVETPKDSVAARVAPGLVVSVWVVRLAVIAAVVNLARSLAHRNSAGRRLAV